MTNETTKQVTDLVEKAAKTMADANDVEGAWFLRGVLDGLLGNEPDSPGGAYGINYRAGYEAAKKNA